jgi:hypothetical protein
MKKILKTIRVGEFENGDYANITIYENFLEFQIFLNQNAIYELIEAGGVALERKGLNSFLRKILDEPFSGLIIFSSEEDFLIWRDQIPFKVPDYSNGTWSYTAVFMFAREKEFKIELEGILLFVKHKCSKYQITTIAEKTKVVEGLIEKHFNINM